MSDRTRKLVALRSRTDHDLLVLVQRELDRGFVLIDLATTTNSPLYTQAEKAYGTATMLLAKTSGLSEGHRGQLEARLRDLRLRLDQGPAFTKLEWYPASFAS